MGETANKRRTSVGVLFWIAFILLVLVIFLANRKNMERVLETTGLLDVIRNRMTVEQTAPAEDPAVESDGLPSPPVATPREESPTDEGNPSVAVETPEPDIVFDEPANTVVEEDSGIRETEPFTAPVPQPDVSKPNRRMAALYYIKVTDDGRTQAHRVVRAVDYAESPLTETIRTLISGPTGEELDDGLLNLIPSSTELISAHVEDGVAYLNFNQAFRFNPLGAEGTVAQLQQIIYSSTEFPTVTRVQFLIEGEKFDYVGGDGIYIGEPLGRDAFS